MPGIYHDGQEPRQLNDEAEQWVTVIDPQTGQPTRIRRVTNLHEVRPGVAPVRPQVRPLNED